MDTSRTWHTAKRRHVVRRVRPRARPPSAGRLLELSGCETAAGIERDAPVAAKLSSPGRPVGCRVVSDGSGIVQAVLY
eukprot:1063584-Prymnesium_polylepis.1